MSQPLLQDGNPAPGEPPPLSPPVEPVPPPDGVPAPPPMVGSPYPDEPPPVYEPLDAEKTGYAAPPSYSYQGSYPQGQPVVIHHVPFGPHPTTIKCPNCLATVTTTVTYTPGALTWLLSGLLCLFGLWLGCCLIPFCITSLSDSTHTCPNCNSILAHHRRL